MSETRTGALAAASAALFFGSSYVATAFALRAYGPLAIGAWRGLAPVLIEGLMDTIGRLNAAGTTILIVEQDVQAALERATRGYVLETGHMVLAGTSAELLADERVRRAYLGV